MPEVIAVLGSTGSVGTQSLDVARAHGIKVDYISGNSNVKLLESQIREFSPAYCAVADEKAAKSLSVAVADTKTKILSGADGICEGISQTSAECVVNSILGEAGLMPTLAVIDSGKRLALSNKESLVIAGDIVMSRAREKNAEILPVDSEHSAIFQSLQGNDRKSIKNIYLTASGGPFFGKTKEQLRSVSLSDVLAHPTWKMGAKITIDSATLMNKGFEVIEAVHLFGVEAQNVEVVVHRESIIHSMVEYIDNSVIAQLSVPDMRFCVQYAVNYPERDDAVIDTLDLFSVGTLHFARPDYKTFSLLACAIEAIKKGGALPAVLNAANEVAVAAFLNREISFYDITEIVGDTVTQMEASSKYTSLEDILDCDVEARRVMREKISKRCK